MTHLITPIAYIASPFTQKFSIPRQGLGLSCAKGEISFCDYINVSQSLNGIEDFSHLWLLFLFHQNIAQGFKAKVRPPRLGGNKKIGVFASRSSFRPNGIGMSLVKNLGIHKGKLLVEGVDLLNNTPIIDIKPYLPYADSMPCASAGYAHDKPTASLTLEYSPQATLKLQHYQTTYPDLANLLFSVLSQDPRPSYKKNKPDDKLYVISLYDVEISWCVNDGTLSVIDLYTMQK